MYNKKIYLFIEVCSQHLYASFGTFCVEIGHLFEALWVFEEYLEIYNSPFSTENVADFELLMIFKDALRIE